ncbi:MAG: GNAT family N-acetyltransferase [Hyphomonas sp.]
MTALLTHRRNLTTPMPVPEWPDGISLATFSEDMAPALHALMAAGYGPGEGDVEAFEQWWPALLNDREFDPALVFVARASDGAYAGVCQCWTSAFIKDLVVAKAFRGRRIGEALMLTAFEAFRQRGADWLDLKVLPGNVRALRLYRHLGMVAA